MSLVESGGHIVFIVFNILFMIRSRNSVSIIQSAHLLIRMNIIRVLIGDYIHWFYVVCKEQMLVLI